MWKWNISHFAKSQKLDEVWPNSRWRYFSVERNKCCQVNFVQNRRGWRFFAKKRRFIATTLVLLHFYVVMNWQNIAKWPKLAIFALFNLSKFADLVIYRHSWQHCILQLSNKQVFSWVQIYAQYGNNVRFSDRGTHKNRNDKPNHFVFQHF